MNGYQRICMDMYGLSIFWWGNSSHAHVQVKLEISPKNAPPAVGSMAWGPMHSGRLPHCLQHSRPGRDCAVGTLKGVWRTAWWMQYIGPSGR